ncbi:MAG TPA: succinate--CoA ligase subunit alpha [archaeon]|nr:succinate--CoA ligase subunit alpha [archaeon]
MSVLLGKKTKAIIQGITGEQGSFHAGLMLKYGTQIVAGVVPKRAKKTVHGVPVYSTVKAALKERPGVEWSVLFVPARFAKNAAIEALENGLNLVIVTEGMPVHDSIQVMQVAKKLGRTVVGPNCPGVAAAGESKLGIIPGSILAKGSVGVVSRSGTLTYEIVQGLSRAGLGESTVIGVGGDPVIGLDFVEALKLFEKDPQTRSVALIGEIGGDLEERAASFIKTGAVKKKVVAYIAGRTAPEGKRMGHAGAIVSGNAGTAESKVKAFTEAGVRVALLPSQVVELLS